MAERWALSWDITVWSSSKLFGASSGCCNTTFGGASFETFVFLYQRKCKWSSNVSACHAIQAWSSTCQAETRQSQLTCHVPWGATHLIAHCWEILDMPSSLEYPSKSKSETHSVLKKYCKTLLIRFLGLCRKKDMPSHHTSFNLEKS